MQLSRIVDTSNRVARTRSRIAKIEHLTACLRALPAQEIEVGVAYLMGELPQGRIGIGYALINNARAGAAAINPTLSLRNVDESIDRIARTKGPGSAKKRVQLLSSLLSRGTSDEQQFLIRLLLGELRQGALEGVIIEAIAHAADLSSERVRRAVMLAGYAPAVASAVLREGSQGLSRFSLEILKPVKPMLADAAEDVSEALRRLGTAAFEFKLDGARIQVHKLGSDVRIFSRRLNDVSIAVPELVEAIEGIPVDRIILDGETLVLRSDGKPQPFQTTMRRFGRKLDVARMRERLPLKAYFFDCLYIDGDALIDRPAQERFAALAEILPAGMVIPRVVSNREDEAQSFYNEALRRGHEGAVAKALHTHYEAGNRGSSWLKLKRFHTLDLVVLAAEWGSGRRRGWLSNLHLGARDTVAQGFVMLGKTFKGMTDEMLAWQTEHLKQLEIATNGHVVHVRPELVVEVAFDEIQVSSRYPAGLALRFARIKRYRPDRRAEDADTIETVRAIHGRRFGEMP